MVRVVFGLLSLLSCIMQAIVIRRFNIYKQVQFINTVCGQVCLHHCMALLYSLLDRSQRFNVCKKIDYLFQVQILLSIE